MFVYIFKGSDPVSPCSPSSPNPAMTASERSITSPIDLAKALANLQSTSVGIFFLNSHHCNNSYSSYYFDFKMIFFSFLATFI